MKTLEEIKANMDLTQAKFPALNPLATNTSEVSFFNTLRNMFAILYQAFQAEQDVFLSDVTTKIADTRVGSISWYADQVKSFQFGDPISIVNGRVGYDVIDEKKQIVKQAAVVEDSVSGRLAIKAVKANSEILTSDELAALKEYVSKVKYAGVLADVNSIEADDLKLICSVKIDKQVIGPNGQSLVDSSKAPVWDAISAYIRSLPNTSLLNNTDLVDAVQSVKGVKDFSITSCFTKRPVSNTWIEYNRETISLAGHLKLHADSQFSYVN